MAKTLKKANDRLQKDQAYEAGDVLMSVCKTFGIKDVCYEHGHSTGRTLRDSEWCWLSLDEGRNRYLQLIAEAQEAQKAKTAKKHARSPENDFFAEKSAPARS
jgi:hypothetical protein